MPNMNDALDAGIKAVGWNDVALRASCGAHSMRCSSRWARRRRARMRGRVAVGVGEP
jgi:hypothetical protein